MKKKALVGLQALEARKILRQLARLGYETDKDPGLNELAADDLAARNDPFHF